MPAEKSFALSFQVENKEEFLGKLKEIMEEMRELLKEFGKSFHDIIDQIEFKYEIDD